MRTFAAETTNMVGKTVYLTFDARSIKEAHLIIQDRGLIVQHLTELPQLQSYPAASLREIATLTFKITRIVDGIELFFPIPNDVRKLFRELLLLGGACGVGSAMMMIVGGSADLWLPLWLIGCFSVLWGIWIIGTKISPYFLRYGHIMFEQDVLTVRNVLPGIGKRQEYHLEQIRNVQLENDRNAASWRVTFKYAGQIVRFLQFKDQTAAHGVAKFLHDILTFRCHAVDTIRFGAAYAPHDDPNRVLDNPEVADLTTPFFQLERLIIDADTYDFYRLERFLTYAVNYVGQDYLRDYVMVRIDGDKTRLHPNLRNTLVNLCHNIRWDDKHAMTRLT